MQTKMYLTKYGIFYEGQLLYRYLWSNNRLFYNDEVILDKFIFHYKTGSPKLYCRMFLKDIGRKTRNYITVSGDQLGILYKIKRF